MVKCVNLHFFEVVWEFHRFSPKINFVLNIRKFYFNAFNLFNLDIIIFDYIFQLLTYFKLKN